MSEEPKKVVRYVLKKGKDTEDLQTQLDEKTAILEKQALETFQNEKEALLELAKDRMSTYEYEGLEDKLKDIKPSNFKDVKNVLEGVLGERISKSNPPAKKKPVVQGKSIFLPEGGGGEEGYESEADVVNAIYSVLEKAPRDSPEFKEAMRNRNELWKTFGSNEKMRRAHKEGKLATASDTMFRCTSCGYDYNTAKHGSICPKCGYNFRTPKAKIRAGKNTFRSWD